MTDEQKELFIMILKQQDDILAAHWQMLQIIAPLPMMEDEDGSEPSRTLQ